MRIQIVAAGIELTPAIRAYVEQKLGMLERMLQKYEEQGELEIAVEVSKTTRHHRHGEIFYAESTLRVPGATLRSEHEANGLYEAIDGMKDILKKEIIQHKGKTKLAVRRLAPRHEHK